MTEHVVRTEAQPVADQVMAICSCGWREAVSIWESDHPGGDAAELSLTHKRLASGE